MEKSKTLKVRIRSEDWFEENCERKFIGGYESYYNKENDSFVLLECVNKYAGKTINVYDDDDDGGEFVVCDNTYDYIEDWMIESITKEVT